MIICTNLIQLFVILSDVIHTRACVHDWMYLSCDLTNFLLFQVFRIDIYVEQKCGWLSSEFQVSSWSVELPYCIERNNFAQSLDLDWLIYNNFSCFLGMMFSSSKVIFNDWLSMFLWRTKLNVVCCWKSCHTIFLWGWWFLNLTAVDVLHWAYNRQFHNYLFMRLMVPELNRRRCFTLSK